MCCNRRNATNSTDGGLLAKFLSTTQLNDQLSSTDDVSTHSRVRRWTRVDIETIQRRSQNLNSRSKCPWTYRYNTDPNRLPQTLIEARCNQKYVDRLAGQCEHVYYDVPVRRRNNAGRWTDEWLRLPVGCTLAAPIVAPVPQITFN